MNTPAEGPASLAGAVDEHAGPVSRVAAGTDAAGSNAVSTNEPGTAAAGGFTMLGEAGTACEGDACLI
ncbi:hypothetical protein [Pseudoclavibacter helvolus]|uniref:hypothetical protein n=1 Tax=Pseudoclavibacter helvolus TaxID=255205 RepID=UPI003C767601